MPRTPIHAGRLTLILCVFAGCQSPHATEGPSEAEAWRLMQPTRVVVLPFTKPKSFDQDAYPDGLEVSVRLIDSMGDAVKGWGTFRFDLYGYKKASGQPRGELEQEPWFVHIDSIEAQRTYWDSVTQTYRFPLAWAGRPLKPNSRYVLDVTFQPPVGDRVAAEPYEIQFQPDFDLMQPQRGR